MLTYLDCLRNADTSGIDELFTVDAKVKSPLYGIRDAREFFDDLFSVTSRSSIELRSIFVGARTAMTIAAQFEYTWTLASSERVSFECVDIFKLRREPGPKRRWFGLGPPSPRTRIEGLQIIYDTYEARPKFDRAVGGNR